VIAALEIGGTHVTAARVELRSSTVHETTRRPLPREGVLAAVVGAAAPVAPGSERLGVAVPGPFDYERGISLARHKLRELHGLDLRRELAAALGFEPSSIRFLNDAAAFVLGESWVGAARGHRRVMGITLGTGLGSAFLDAGRIVEEGPGVPPGGALHLVPFRGAPVERTVSRQALLERWGADESLDVRDIADRARQGDEGAREAFRNYAAALGEFLAPWLSAFAPSCLVVGGSIARAWDLIATDIGQHLTGIPGLEVVAVSGRLDDAPLLGAALYAVRG
jgi:glucokinase